MSKKTILVACVGGVATGTVITNILQEEFKNRGLDVYVNQISVAEIDTVMPITQPVAIITTGSAEKKWEIPAFSGLPFITGVGAAELLEEIIKVVEK